MTTDTDQPSSESTTRSRSKPPKSPKPAASRETEAAAPEAEGKAPKRSSAVGPQDGAKGFDRCKSVLSKLHPTVRRRVVAAITQYAQLCDQDEVEAEGGAGPQGEPAPAPQLF